MGSSSYKTAVGRKVRCHRVAVEIVGEWLGVGVVVLQANSRFLVRLRALWNDKAIFYGDLLCAWVLCKVEVNVKGNGQGCPFHTGVASLR